MSYSQLPPRLRTYIAVSAAAAVLAAGSTLRGHHVHDWKLFLGLLARSTKWAIPLIVLLLMVASGFIPRKR